MIAAGFWLGLLVGVWIGAALGILIAGLLRAAADADDANGTR